MYKNLLRWYLTRAGLMLGALALIVEKDAWEKLPKDVQALYVEKDGKYALDVDGVEDTSGLKSALKKERDAVKAEAKLRKELEERFEGIDPDAVREMMKQLDTDEDTKLVAKGQIDKVIEKRVEQMRKGFEKQLKEAQDQTTAEKARTQKYSQRVLDNTIRAAAAKAGIHAHAVEDALFRARSMFTLTEDGDAVTLDEAGHPKVGKDGKTPFSPVEWLESMKDTAPHWFPANSNGAGSRGDGGPNGGGPKTVKRADFDKMDPVTQQATAKKAAAKEVTIVDA